MKRLGLTSALMVLLGVLPCAGTVLARSGKDDALRLIDRAAAAMGGGTIRALKITGVGHKYMVEQSERPEGPWLVTYDEFTVTRDLGGKRLRVESADSIPALDFKGKTTLVVAQGAAALDRGGRMFPGSVGQLQEAEADLALAPESLAATARAASDLRTEADTVLQDVPHHCLGFTWNGTPVRVYLNAHTGLPTAVDVTRAMPGDFFWGIWGDFTTRTYYSFWTLEAGGMRYPRQWDIERNGKPFRTVTVTKLDINPAIADADFTVTEDARTGFAKRGAQKIVDLPLGRPDRPATEIVPGIVQIPGFWNVALVRQDDGIVILEAPISSGYSAKVIAEAEKRFPGMKIKAAISTSDAWPHLGGVREYAARGIPLYVLDVNQPIIRRVLAARFATDPDMLAKQPRKADLRIVSGRLSLGTGPNRLDLMPIRSETGERMLMVYAPEHRLLYGSDLIQGSPNGKFFMPQYLSEVADAVTRERLAVDRVFAMHTEAIEWKRVLDAITEATKSKDAKDGR